MAERQESNRNGGRRVPASELLRCFARDFPHDRVSLGDVIAALDDRAFGLLILLLAFPNIFPTPILGLSGALGTPLALVAFQLMVGRHRPWLPKWVTRRSVARSAFVRLIDRVVPYLERVERLLRPRWAPASGWTAERLVAAFCIVLAVVLALPIPLGNTLPALALSLIALGLIERDGLFIIAGTGAGVVGLVLAWAVIAALFHATFYFLVKVFA